MDTKDEFDELNDALRPLGLTLDELIESGREIRGELLKEMYGIEVSDPGDHDETTHNSPRRNLER